MTSSVPRILLTGAAGYVGAALTRALRADPVWGRAHLILCDRVPVAAPPIGNVTIIQGDFAEPDLIAQLTSPAPDVVFHLAGVLGGAAEANYDLARRVNVDATLSLLEALRRPTAPPRVVYASSIAVFGPVSDLTIDDETPPRPTQVYGGQKRMMEVVIEQFSARGWIDGLALRLPGIVARPGSGEGLKSAFLSDLFHSYAAGRDIVLPVSADGTTWLVSVESCAEALVHAASLSTEKLGLRRALTLPAQCVRFDDVVAGLGRRFPDSPSRVAYVPDAALQAQFGRKPMLETPLADTLGFRHDGDLDTLIRRALTPAGG